MPLQAFATSALRNSIGRRALKQFFCIICIILYLILFIYQIEFLPAPARQTATPPPTTRTVESSTQSENIRVSNIEPPAASSSSVNQRQDSTVQNVTNQPIVHQWPLNSEVSNHHFMAATPSDNNYQQQPTPPQSYNSQTNSNSYKTFYGTNYQENYQPNLISIESHETTIIDLDSNDGPQNEDLSVDPQPRGRLRIINQTGPMTENIQDLKNQHQTQNQSNHLETHSSNSIWSNPLYGTNLLTAPFDPPEFESWYSQYNYNDDTGSWTTPAVTSEQRLPEPQNKGDDDVATNNRDLLILRQEKLCVTSQYFFIPKNINFKTFQYFFDFFIGN